MKIQALIGVLLAVTVGIAFAAPRDRFEVTKTYRNHGNTRAVFSVTITSTAWTSILSADVKRRYAIFQTTSAVASTSEVCLSTVSAAATVCSATTEGRHIPRVGVVIEDYSEAVLYGRRIGGSINVAAESLLLIGETQSDSGDALDANK